MAAIGKSCAAAARVGFGIGGFHLALRGWSLASVARVAANQFTGGYLVRCKAR
jgi:hypothetical protein